MDIKLNSFETNFKVSLIKGNADAVKLPELNGTICNNAYALCEFVSAYKGFSEAVNSYIAVLNKDLQKISTATATIQETDTMLGNNFGNISGKNLGTLSGNSNFGTIGGK